MLNEDYYKQLLEKFPVSEDCDEIIGLTANMIFHNYRSENISFSFPQGYDIAEVVNALFENLSQKIFINHADIKDYSVGVKLERKNQKGKKLYVVERIIDKIYYLKLQNDSNNTIIPSSFDKLKRNFFEVRQSARNSTLFKYQNYFKSINNFGFLPTYFSKKNVLIAGPMIWKNLINKDSIPSIYLPNAQGKEQTSTYSIPALEDCINYVTPKYAVCKDEILNKDIIVDTVIVCDTDLDSISQIIQDQLTYNFKLIIISRECINQNIISSWSWKNEELDMFKNKKIQELINNKSCIIDIADEKKVDDGFIITLLNGLKVFVPKYHYFWSEKGRAIVSEKLLKKKEFVNTYIYFEKTKGKKVMVSEELLTKEEFLQYKIDLIENIQSNIEVCCIEDEGFDFLINHFDDCIEYVSNLNVPIILKGYGYLLRIALNAIKDEQFEALILRLENNKELERNEGGFEDFGDMNPKEALLKLIQYLKEHNLKYIRLKETIINATDPIYIVAEREDIELLKDIKNRRCDIITNKELKILIKNKATNNRQILFYSFNGSKDFDFIYNLSNNVKLLLYNSENELYHRQVQINKEQLEDELTSEIRMSISGVEYRRSIEEEVKVSPTLQQTIARLEELSKTGYAGYKDESDMALDDLEDKITYKITFSDNSHITIESNETVFKDQGNLIKSWRLKIGDLVQIYPRSLADDLYQVAVEQEPEIFGEIEKQSMLWQNILKELDKHFLNRDKLYNELKYHGLKVLYKTVEAYFDGLRKFPMNNTDLRAIFSLADKVLENKNHIKHLYPKLIPSKRLYNSTMIVLGRGVKQELKQFLKDETIGEILEKKAFTKDILMKFVEDDMPILEIKRIEEVNDEQ